MGRNKIKAQVSVRTKAYRQEKSKELRDKQKKFLVEENVAVLEVEDDRSGKTTER